MTNKEWLNRVLDHNESERVPYNFMFSPPVQRALAAHYGTDDLETALSLPIRMNGPASIKPLYADPAVYGPTITDEFGVIWSTNSIDRGSPIGPCLKQSSLSNYHFPAPLSGYRFEHLAGWCMSQESNFRVLWIGDLWERATFMRGMQEILLDIISEPVFVHELLGNIADYILQTMRIVFDNCEFEAIALSDDYGAQQGMIISPEHWRKFVKPQLTRIYVSAKSAGKIIFHHSCGHIVPVIPDLIELGLDILHPIQPEAMDIFELKRNFGKDLTFCGGMPTQNVLPHGSTEQVKQEVINITTKMSRGGGYIFEPGITLLADVPLENILTMLNAVI